MSDIPKPAFDAALAEIKEWNEKFNSPDISHVGRHVAAYMATVIKGSFDASAVMAEENRILREQLATCKKAIQEIRSANHNEFGCVSDSGIEAIIVQYESQQKEQAP